ncbi:MAG: tetratricopeptide repeat protein [Desulforegulaceae bacterium]|nr:tetratricopeptide repeat protein [Desulforegulaceae bacterium]
MTNDFKIKNKCFIFLIFSFFTILIYSNSFDAEWHFDDFHNILDNPQITIDNLYPETLKNTLFASTDGKGRLYRPVAMFSFALNWYFGGADVFGYHLVNVIIHIFAGFFLFLAIIELFKTPVLKDKYKNKDIYNIALFSSVLWLIHPIQIQAVTYIVQRMASMSAMFFIISCFSYLKARTSKPLKTKIKFFSLSFLCFLLASGAKENALILPFSLFLIEIVFFQTFEKISGKKLSIIIGILFIFGLILIYKFVGFKLPSHGGRNFTLSERLMTESRIIFKYLYQLFYPISSQYSLIHDIEVSKSLFKPLTTILSIILIIFILFFSFLFRKKFPVLCFAILFFFLNHSVESTIIPLELIFEHRNYLPSMFLFLPLGIMVNYSLKYYKNKSSLFYILITSYTGIIVFVGLATYTRNFDWKTEESLWIDVCEKAPQSARSYHNLGGVYLKYGLLDKAQELYEKAIGLYDSTKNKDKIISYNGLAAISLRNEEYIDNALYSKKALDLMSENSKYIYRYVNAIVKSGDYDKAYLYLENEIKDNSWNLDLLNIKTYILLKLDKEKQALENALETFKKCNNSSEALALLALCFYENDIDHKTKHFLLIAKNLNIKPEYKFYVNLCLLDMGIKTNDDEVINKNLKEFFKLYNLNYIKDELFKYKQDEYKLVNVSADEILDKIKNFLS